MVWAELALAVVAGISVIGLPGVLVAWSIRLRGLWLAALTPLLGVSMIAVAAFVAPLFGVTWSPLPLLVVAVMFAGGLWFITARMPTIRQVRSPRRASVIVAVVAGATLICIQIVGAIGSPDLFSQAYDSMFHLNAVQYVLDTGSASPVDVARLTGGTAYPSAWHALGAMVVQLTGVSIPVASNAALIVVACGIWPLGAVLLTRTLFGSGPVVLLAAGILSAAFGAFPLRLVAYISPFPLVLSIAMLPAALALAVEIAGLRKSLGRWPAALGFVLVVPAITVAHPSTLISVAVLAIPVVGVAAARAIRRADKWPARRIPLFMFVGYCASVLIAVLYVRPSAGSGSDARGSVGQAFGEAITASMGGLPLALGVAALTLAGAIAAVRRRTATGLAAVGMWTAALALYVVAAGGQEFWRMLIVGPWYTDDVRVAALAPAVMLPLAAVGADVTWRAGRAWLDRRGALRWRWAPFVLATIGVLGLVSMTQASAVRSVVNLTHALFQPTDTALPAVVTLDDDERALMARIPELVPEGDLIAGNPWTGMGFAYALTGRPVLMPHLIGNWDAPTMSFVNGFSAASVQDPACTATRDLGVRWVLDFTNESGTRPIAPHYAGLEGLDRSANVRLVAREGEASLYKVIGCGLSD